MIKKPYQTQGSERVDVYGKLLVICPYCRHGNRLVAKNIGAREAITCDIDEGGCDEIFVAEFERKVFVDIEVYRLEGVNRQTAKTDHSKDGAGDWTHEDQLAWESNERGAKNEHG